MPPSNPAAWRTYGEATIADNVLTVGQVGDTEYDTQPSGYHGASIALAPAESYTFMFDLSLATWDSYNDSYSDSSGTGFWDSFSISVTNLPYDTLQLTNDPLQFPFVWGGTQWGDGVLASFSDNELTLTFPGDGENVKYLNLVLDTGNPPEADNLYPSWGAFSLPLTNGSGNLRAYRPMQGPGSYFPFAKTPVAEQDEESTTLGPGIRINGDYDNGTATRDFQYNGTLVPNENDLIEIRVDQLPGMNNLVLQRSSNTLLLFTSSQKGDPFYIDPDTNQSDPLTGGSLTLFVEWASLSHGTEDLSLIDTNTNTVIDTLTFHTFTSITIVLGGFQQVPSPTEPFNFGMFRTADQLYSQGFDVMKFDEDEVAAFINPGSGVPYDEVENAVNNRLVNNVAILGYSQGGGSTFNLSAWLEQRRILGYISAFNLVFTAYVDAVRDDGAGQETRLPVNTMWHLNLYQDGTNDPNNPLNLDGGSVPGSNDNLFVETSLIVSVPNATHFNIDDDPGVINWIKLRYFQNVSR